MWQTMFSLMKPWGLSMSIDVGHPFSPMGGLVRVRREYRTTVANQYGQFYASTNLALRKRKDGELLFAPLAVGPGDVVTFIWPPAPIDVDWMEHVGRCG